MNFSYTLIATSRYGNNMIIVSRLVRIKFYLNAIDYRMATLSMDHRLLGVMECKLNHEAGCL